MNTNYRVGNKVKTRQAISGIAKGAVVEIINSYPNEPRWVVFKPNTTLQVSLKTVYLCPLSKKENIKALNEEKEELEDRLRCITKELDIATKYKDEEDYLAHKISNILKNKDSPEAIREILKEGHTHLL